MVIVSEVIDQAGSYDVWPDASAEAGGSFGLFRHEVRNIPLLDQPTELRLAQTVARGAEATATLLSMKTVDQEELELLQDEVESAREARELMAQSNLRLVVSIARRYANRGLSLEDLIQAGSMGLLRAIDRYDYRRGFRLSTYATWWIRQAVGRALANHGRTVRIPAHLQEAASRATRLETAVWQSQGRSPSPDELSQVAGVSPRRLREITRMLATPMSLDDPQLGSDARLMDIVADEDSEPLDQHVDLGQLSSEIQRLLEGLSARDRLVLQMRYGLSGHRAQSREEVARALSVTRERARQIEMRALAKLRNGSPLDRLRDFLN